MRGNLFVDLAIIIGLELDRAILQRGFIVGGRQLPHRQVHCAPGRLVPLDQRPVEGLSPLAPADRTHQVGETDDQQETGQDTPVQQPHIVQV